MTAIGRIRVLLVALLAVLANGGCQIQADAPTTVLVPGDDRYISDLAWLPDGTIWLLRGYGSDGPDELERATADGRSAVVSIPSAVGCADPEWIDLATLPDGRLGALESCEDALGNESRTAIAIDGDHVTKLASLGPTYRVVGWDPGLRSGWVQQWIGGCAGVERLVDGTPVPFPAHHPADLLPWSGGLPEHGGCPPSGRIGFITSSTAGDLYFLATGQEDKNTLEDDAAWRLYSFRAATGELRRIGPELTAPHDLAVRPDGQQVLFAGRREERQGLWRVDLASGKASLVLRGRIDAIAPAADGRRVALVRPGPGPGDEVVEVTLD